jgi:methylmalonyl-CoA mutase
MDEPQNQPASAPEQLRAWRESVERSLNGRPFSVLQSRTRDGIVIEPLYGRAAAGEAIVGRGATSWTIVQVLDDPDPECANQQALRDIEGGAAGLALRFAGAPLGMERGLQPTEAALAVALEDVDVAAVQLRIDPHPLGSRIAQWLRDLVARRAVAPELTRICFGLDPVASVLQQSGMPDELRILGEAAFSLHRSGFSGAMGVLDGRPFHEAGATEAQELAAVLASAAWWLRELLQTGMPDETRWGCLGASLAVDCDQFLSIAKIRALRLLWGRIEELCGAAPRDLPIHAETSRRMLTAAAPHTNMVRATIATFAAAVGGADSIAVRPYSAALTCRDEAARALARNTHHLLLHEANIHRVADPSAGSGAVEAITHALAEAAWAEFRKIESEGGIIGSFRSGALPARIAAAREQLGRQVAEGAVPLVGATVYRDPEAAEVTVTCDTGPLRPVRLEHLAAPS